MPLNIYMCYRKARLCYAVQCMYAVAKVCIYPLSINCNLCGGARCIYVGEFSKRKAFAGYSADSYSLFVKKSINVYAPRKLVYMCVLDCVLLWYSVGYLCLRLFCQNIMLHLCK